MIWIVFGAMALATCIAVGKIFAQRDRIRTQRGIRTAALVAWAIGLILTLAGRPIVGLSLMAIGAAGTFLVPPSKRRASVGSKRQRHGRAAGWGPHVEADADPWAGEDRLRPGVMTEQQAYQILGVQPGASLEEIGRAHRSLMKKLHPDQGGTNELAARANAARDVLVKRSHERPRPH